MNQSEENMDLMMFDYLEGNLKGEKLNEFEKELLADEMLRDELNVWESSYLKREFYDTSELESRILRKPTSNFTIIAYLNAFLIICLSFISSTQYRVTHVVQPLSELALVENLNIKPAFINRQTVITPSKIVPRELPVTHELPDEKVIPDITKQGDKKPFFNVTAIENIATQQPVSSVPPFISLKSMKRIKPEAILAVKNKEQKKAKRIKHKPVKSYPEPKFIKGKIPYVVPLNSENF